jgi:putative transposase
MGRPRRVSAGGYIYHVLNRGNGRTTIFRKDGDFTAFEQVLSEALERVPGVRLLAYCLMPNHWHLVVWPRKDGELSDFMYWLSLTHTQRWHAQHKKVGQGHLYQGRFKSFPIADDDHCLAVCRYVERNALRAGLVKRADRWRWGSLWRRQGGKAEQPLKLATGSMALPKNWADLVNEPQTEAEVAAIRHSVQRGVPYGSDAWVKRAAAKLDLTSTLRPRGRPRKKGT